jgi:hypothetical protein
MTTMIKPKASKQTYLPSPTNSNNGVPIISNGRPWSSMVWKLGAWFFNCIGYSIIQGKDINEPEKKSFWSNLWRNSLQSLLEAFYISTTSNRQRCRPKLMVIWIIKVVTKRPMRNSYFKYYTMNSTLFGDAVSGVYIHHQFGVVSLYRLSLVSKL